MTSHLALIAVSDLRFFKRTTMGKPLLMGRRTWESIGRPLPGRRMIVLSRDPGYQAPGCTVARSLDEAVEIAGTVPEIMVIGGATLYQQTLPRAERFPEWDERDWRLVWEESHPADVEHAWPYRFQQWERVRVS